jgi:hypothetical protein
MLLGCSSNDTDEQGGGGEPSVVAFSPPAVSGPSPRFGVPLPEGAALDQGASNTEAEVFTVASPTTFGDVNAFYKQEMDGKPFRDFEWCGPRVDAASETYLRIWRRPGTSDLMVVGLTYKAPSEPTTISITQASGVMVDACPPAASG